MKCITCLCVNDVEDENDTKCNHFIPCPQCLKLLYCSTSCAEVGWYGHRYFCDVSVNKSSREDQLVKKHQGFQQLRQQEEKLKKQLKDVLHCLVSEKDSEPSYEVLLSLLNMIYSFNDMNTWVLSESVSLLIREVSDNLDVVFSQTIPSLVNMTIVVLLEAKLQSLFLRNHDAALRVLVRGMAKIKSRETSKEVLQFQQILEDERRNTWTRKYPKVIMTSTEIPQSSQQIKCGEIVAVNSIPFLSWKSTNFPPVLSPRDSSLYDEGLKSLRDSFINWQNTDLLYTQLMEDEHEAIAQLLVQELPSLQHIEANVVVSLLTYLTILNETPLLLLKPSPPRWLVTLFFSAIISRRRYNSNMWGFFELISRLIHSCAPNCIWNYETGELKALREIAPHEPLTMDVIFSSLTDTTRQMIMMKLPTNFRQEIIKTSIGILCSCERCTGRRIHFHDLSETIHKEGQEKEKINEEEYSNEINTFDFLRGFPCPLCRAEEGWRYRQQYQEEQNQTNEKESNQTNRIAIQRHFTPYEPWVCHYCKEKWRDSDLPLEREKQLCRKAERLLLMASRSIIGKGFFEEIKTLMQDVLHIFGRQHHSIYLIGCETFILFYRYIATRFSSTTSLLAQRHIIAWCRKWIRCAQNTLLIRNCPHIYSSFIVDTALSLTSVSVLREKVILLRHAEMYCPAAVINGTKSKTATTVADILYNSTSPVFTTMAKTTSAFTTFMKVEEQEWEDALISEWESHLMERVHTELNSNEKPNLPTKILQVIQKD